MCENNAGKSASGASLMFKQLFRGFSRQKSVLSEVAHHWFEIFMFLKLKRQPVVTQSRTVCFIYLGAYRVKLL